MAAFLWLVTLKHVGSLIVKKKKQAEGSLNSNLGGLKNLPDLAQDHLFKNIREKA